MTDREFDREFNKIERRIDRQNRIVSILFWLIFAAAIVAMIAVAYFVIWSPETIGRAFGRIVAGFRSVG